MFIFLSLFCSALLCVGYFDFWTFVLWRKGWHSWLIFVHKTPTTTNNRGVGEPGRFFTTQFFYFLFSSSFKIYPFFSVS